MTFEIALTYGILTLAVILFSTEFLRADLTAMLIMIILPWTGLISVSEAFSGFSSNAVISVMGVMMLGYGMEKSGIMKKFSDFIMSKAGDSEKKILILITLSVGLVSSFMQNIGAAALFLPVVRKLSANTETSRSKIIMPMGFAAILGGTMTMVASGPLIVLNDLLEPKGYSRFDLFDVTPIGLALLTAGILYFLLLGDKVLPNPEKDHSMDHQDYLKHLYDLPETVYELTIPETSLLIGKTIEEINLWGGYDLHIIALNESQSTDYAPWRKTRFKSGQVMAVLGSKEKVTIFSENYSLPLKKDLQVFRDIKDKDYAGFAELIIPPNSNFKNKKIQEVAFRKNFNVEPVAFLNREGDMIENFDYPLQSGEEIVVFGRWNDINQLKNNRNLILVDQGRSSEHIPKDGNPWMALMSLAVSLTMILLGMELSLGFFTGALLMIITKVMPKEEIYRAIDWKTVFLLAGLIPLGIAFEKSGSAKFTADFIVRSISGWNVLAILAVISILASLFSLFMSNVAATVLLVPLIILMGENFGLDPRGLALLVAVSASNSFILPTHQVNAFLLTPGGYKNSDYLKAGGIMTLVFLTVAILMTYLIYI
ncbi:SLC13 family permease [Alkalibacter mobilis]|uniref:SLC13 family permease n=1 Tax=Alkalibacter mobilis TaxID=2787712 RepID=UPI00189F5C6F|nr:SLC13 family permease [Alkalibacter mobilis]MBF7097446.1 SLC13 family permease [Alkalibacter mobilis]